MKKVSIYLALLIMLLQFSVTMAQEKKKVAMISFFGNRRIEMGGYSLIADKILKDTTFNITKIVKRVYENFNESLKESVVEIIDKKLYVDLPEYKNFENFSTDTSAGMYSLYFTSADPELKILTPHVLFVSDDKNPKKYFSKLLREKNIAEGTMYVKLEFALYDAGFFRNKISALMDITLIDKNGEKIFNVRPNAESDDAVLNVGGTALAQLDKLVPLCEQAVNNLINEELKNKFPKMAKKIAKNWK